MIIVYRQAPDPKEVFSALSEVMRDQGLRWCLYSTTALIAHGFPRRLLVIEVLVEIDDHHLETFRRKLAAAGFDSVRPDIEHHKLRRSLLHFRHRQTNHSLEAILAPTNLREKFAPCTAEPQDPVDAVPVISIEDFVVGKVLTGSPSDLAEVQDLIADRPAAVDCQAVQAILQRLEAISGESGIVQEFVETVSRSQERGRR